MVTERDRDRVSADEMIENTLGETTIPPDVVELTNNLIRVCDGFTFEQAVNACGSALGSLILSAPISAGGKLQTLRNLGERVIAIILMQEEAAEAANTEGKPDADNE